MSEEYGSDRRDPCLNQRSGFVFFVKMVCLTCQDQTAVLPYFTYLSDFMGLHSTALRCKAYTHTAAGLAFQTANTLEADCFPLSALPQKGHSPPKRLRRVIHSLAVPVLGQRK